MLSINVGGFLKDSNKVWVSLSGYNGLCSIDLKTNHIKYVSYIESEKPEELNLYSDIIKYDNKLVLTPCDAKEIAIYDLKSNTWEKISINKQNNQLGSIEKFLFCKSVVVGDNAYFIPWRFPAILKLNLKTLNITYLTDWLQHIENEYNPEVYFFREDVVLDEDENIILISLYYNMIMSINSKNDEVRIIKKEEAGIGNGYLSLAKYNEGYLLQKQNEKKLLICDKDFENVTEISYYKDIVARGHLDFSGSFHFKDYIFFMPFMSNTIVRFNTVTKKNDYVNICNCSSGALIKKYFTADDNIVLFYYGGLIKINENGTITSNERIVVDKQFVGDLMSQCFFDKYILSENDIYTLETFFSAIVSNKTVAD